MFHLVLYAPEIPQNTGNIARTCAVTGCTLHLIEPLGFSVDQKHVKRAGLDYWDKLDVQVHANFDAFLSRYPDAVVFPVETVGSRRYDTIAYPKGAFFLFGQETKGLPEEILRRCSGQAVRLPMRDGLRSLNLSNAAAVMAYEALRQHGFEGLV